MVFILWTQLNPGRWSLGKECLRAVNHDSKGGVRLIAMPCAREFRELSRRRGPFRLSDQLINITWIVALGRHEFAIRSKFKGQPRRPRLKYISAQGPERTATQPERATIDSRANRYVGLFVTPETDVLLKFFHLDIHCDGRHRGREGPCDLINNAVHQR